MNTSTRRALIAAGIAVVLIVPVSVASRFGAASGHSGGPGAGAQGCTVCHLYGSGAGEVVLQGAPQRYRLGATYHLTVRISDPEQAGAGFQISAENPAGHQGALIVTDDTHTQFANAGTDPYYITHTDAGVTQSMADWPNNGGWFEYQLHWEAPTEDVGTLTLFVAGNAVNNGMAFYGDHFYDAYATMPLAVTGDTDGDTDVDLLDFAMLQRCFGVVEPAPDSACAYLDADGDDTVTLNDAADLVDALTGPTTAEPAAYYQANPVRGGVLYDKWWKVLGIAAPAGDHPLYPPDGAQAGSSTFRCKECHGWDYMGVDGAYGSGSHHTGIAGVRNTSLAPSELFAILTADPADTPNGHDMTAYGFTEDALWDVVRMTLEGTLDTDQFIDPAGSFYGDSADGMLAYDTTCAQCHGPDGTDIDFSSDPTNPEYVGTVAVGNPWEFLHKVRFGHPGSPMPRFEALEWPPADAATIGAYAEMLPTE